MFSGYYFGLKMVLIRITKMLRRWMPILKQDTGTVMDELSKQLEDKASRPLQIKMVSLSGLAQLGARLLVPSTVDLIDVSISSVSDSLSDESVSSVSASLSVESVSSVSASLRGCG